jgi:hypothetical protein
MLMLMQPVSYACMLVNYVLLPAAAAAAPDRLINC